MTKETLTSLVSDKSIKMDQSALTLLLSVLLKYGIAPIALIYLGYILMVKDALIQKNSETIISIVREQTIATTKQTVVMESVSKNIEANTRKLDEMDRRTTR